MSYDVDVAVDDFLVLRNGGGRVSWGEEAGGEDGRRERGKGLEGEQIEQRPPARAYLGLCALPLPLALHGLHRRSMATMVRCEKNERSGPSEMRGGRRVSLWLWCEAIVRGPSNHLTCQRG